MSKSTAYGYCQQRRNRGFLTLSERRLQAIIQEFPKYYRKLHESTWHVLLFDTQDAPVPRTHHKKWNANLHESFVKGWKPQHGCPLSLTALDLMSWELEEAFGYRVRPAQERFSVLSRNLRCTQKTAWAAPLLPVPAQASLPPRSLPEIAFVKKLADTRCRQ